MQNEQKSLSCSPPSPINHSALVNFHNFVWMENYENRRQISSLTQNIEYNLKFSDEN